MTDRPEAMKTGEIGKGENVKAATAGSITAAGGMIMPVMNGHLDTPAHIQ